MQTLPGVAEVCRNGLPAGTVASFYSGQRVRHLVQQNLVNLIVFVPSGQVPRYGDSFFGVTAEPRASLGVVETERPFRRIQMQRNESICPLSNPHQISHKSTITRLKAVVFASVLAVEKRKEGSAVKD
jgi:hypothetical protein